MSSLISSEDLQLQYRKAMSVFLMLYMVWGVLFVSRSKRTLTQTAHAVLEAAQALPPPAVLRQRRQTGRRHRAPLLLRAPAAAGSGDKPAGRRGPLRWLLRRATSPLGLFILCGVALSADEKRRRGAAEWARAVSAQVARTWMRDEPEEAPTTKAPPPTDKHRAAAASTPVDVSTALGSDEEYTDDEGDT
jgi:hypothetical protein